MQFDSTNEYLILIGQQIVDHAVSFVPLRSRKCTDIIRYVILRDRQSDDTLLGCVQLEDWPGVSCAIGCVSERPVK